MASWWCGGRWPITVAVEGRYFAIRRFLQILRNRAGLQDEKLRASGRLYGVDSIQFSGGDSTTGGSLIQATLAVTAFVFRGAVANTRFGGHQGTQAGIAAEPASEAAGG